MSEEDDTLTLAETALACSQRNGVDGVIIGATALACHNYVRGTGGIDIGVSSPLEKLRQVLEELRRLSSDVHLQEPAADDPLSGVITVSKEGAGTVKIVNFHKGLPRLIESAIAKAGPPIHPGGKLRVAPLAHAIVLKVYAWSAKSRADIVEVLKANPEADINAIRQLAWENWLDKRLETVLREYEEER